MNNDTKPAASASVKASDAFHRLSEAQSGRGPKAISTGFPSLDYGIVGIMPSNVIVIGGRPGHGKTALASNITESVIRQGHTVLTFSMEMSADELLRRRASALSGIPMDRMMRPQDLTRVELDLLKPHYNFDSKLWYIDDESYRTIDDIIDVTMATRALADKAGSPLKMVVVDHVGLISGGNGQPDGRRLLIGEASRRLKVLSGRTGVGVLLLTQLNRNAASRGGKKGGDMRPVQTDIQECDNLSHDASVILFVHQPFQYFTESPTNEAEIIVAKNRNGSKLGAIKLGWDGAKTRFVDYRSAPTLRVVRSNEDF